MNLAGCIFGHTDVYNNTFGKYLFAKFGQLLFVSLPKYLLESACPWQLGKCICTGNTLLLSTLSRFSTFSKLQLEHNVHVHVQGALIKQKYFVGALPTYKLSFPPIIYLDWNIPLSLQTLINNGFLQNGPINGLLEPAVNRCPVAASGLPEALLLAEVLAKVPPLFTISLNTVPW